MNLTIDERCENCIHLGEIYVPPSNKLYSKPKHVDACFLFAESDKSVMYLDTTASLCECFEPKLTELKGE